jgi:hypothetical protein
MSNIRFEPNFRNREVIGLLRDLENTTERAIRQGWFEVGDDWKKKTNKEILRKPKGGEVYFIRLGPRRRIRHKASRPGETHANLTGKTRRSLSFKVRGFNELTVGYEVSGSTRNRAPIYAPRLEFGGDAIIRGTVQRLLARPSIQNGIRSVIRNAQTYFTNNILRSVDARRRRG